MSILTNPYRQGFVIRAPTFFGVASNPADLGSLTGTQVAITPPASMQVGDLVVVHVACRTLSLTWTVFTTGGQTWNTSSAGYGTGAKSCALFWCTFNGTWAANPVFECLTNAAVISGIMSVFRPDRTSRVWAVDNAFVTSAQAAPAGPPYPLTRAGITTNKPGTVTYGTFHVAGANTFANMTGAGWVDFPTPQYRNGTLSASLAYALNESGGGTVIPTLGKEESASTLGTSTIMSWYAS